MIHPVNPNASKLSPLFKIFIIRNLINKIKPDVLHVQYVIPFGIYGALSGFHPFVASGWGSDIQEFPQISPIHRAVAKYVLKKCDIIHVQDRLSKEIICELSEDFSKKTYVQAWGVDTNRFSHENRSGNIREKHQINNGPIILSVRNLTEFYDVRTLFEAMPHIVKEIPDVKFIILNDGHLKPMFQKMVEEKGIGKNVEFLGFLPNEDFFRYMASADVFVDTYHPPDRRGGMMFGQGVLEAMASGVPQVIANRPEISEYKGEERWYFGYIYNGGNSKDLSQKVITLLNNQNDKKTIGCRSRKMVEERFNWNENMNKIENNLYNVWSR